MTTPIGVQDTIDIFGESPSRGYPQKAQVDTNKAMVPEGFQENVIYMDFIRNYGQLSSGEPKEPPDGIANKSELRNFQHFKENVGFEYKQTGRQRDDKQTFQFYPIKHLDKYGKHTTFDSENTVYELYLNRVPCIPVTDENNAERRSFTPLRDDYIFIIYPRFTIRGVKPFDYMRFKTPTCPPNPRTEPETLQVDEVIQEEQIKNIARMCMPPVESITNTKHREIHREHYGTPIFHRPKYERVGDSESNTVKDEDGIPYRVDNNGDRTEDYYLDYNPDIMDYEENIYWKGDYNWENYTFWQITRILDVPRGFQAFFTRGLSIIY